MTSSQETLPPQMPAVPEKFCQSCGMPLSKDPEGGARLKDGMRSVMYCSYCMVDGEFTYQGNDVQEFQKTVVDIMVQNGWWRPMAWLFTCQIPNPKSQS